MCFSSIKDLYESFMEHTFLEFRRILRVIIHNICHLLQRALKHPVNVYLMLLIQYNIKEDVLYYGGHVCGTAQKLLPLLPAWAGGFITAIKTCIELNGI